MPPETIEQRIARWIKAVNHCHAKGWLSLGSYKRFVFQSPSGTVHDLSAADLNQLDKIENEGIFLVNE